MVITPIDEYKQITFDSIDLSYNFTHALQYINAGFRKISKNKNLKNFLYFILGVIILPILIVISPIFHIVFYLQYRKSKKFYLGVSEIISSLSEKSNLDQEYRNILQETLSNTHNILNKLHDLPEFPLYSKVIFPFIWYVILEKKMLTDIELKIRLLLHPEANEIPLTFDEILELRECLKDFDLPNSFQEVA